jgi:hypothetical protein
MRSGSVKKSGLTENFFTEGIFEKGRSSANNVKMKENLDCENHIRNLYKNHKLKQMRMLYDSDPSQLLSISQEF